MVIAMDAKMHETDGVRGGEGAIQGHQKSSTHSPAQLYTYKLSLNSYVKWDDIEIHSPAQL